MEEITQKKMISYKIGDLFEIKPTKRYNLTNSKLMVEDGNIPVIVNSKKNNGIGGYSNLSATETGNMVTFSDTTTADSIFYQATDFIGYAHIQGLYPKQYEKKWTKYSYLYFITEFKRKALGFDYVNKFNRKIAEEITVELPATEDNEIDFNYMEQYMENIEKDIEDKFNKLKEITSVKI